LKEQKLFGYYSCHLFEPLIHIHITI